MTIGKSCIAPPRVTIVTVVFNARDLLAITIQAVDALNYQNVEHVIVDGGSTDGTVDLLPLERRVSIRYISEKDNGIYDAMNKGIRMATGDYLWFLNAGDTPASNDVLFPFCRDSPPDILYGDNNLIDSDGLFVKRVYAPFSLSSNMMTEGMYVSHQAIVVRRDLAPMYDLRYHYIADQKWIVDSLKKAKNIAYLGLPMSNYLLDGFSQRCFHKFIFEKTRYSFTELPLASAIAITVKDFAKAVRFYMHFGLRRIKSNKRESLVP